MNKDEAAQVAEARLNELRRIPHAQLVEEWLKQPRSESATAPSGRTYQLEIEAVWDDRREKHLRVWVLVDDGGWRASLPLSRDFIVAPDGSFIGE